MVEVEFQDDKNPDKLMGLAARLLHSAEKKQQEMEKGRDNQRRPDCPKCGHIMFPVTLRWKCTDCEYEVTPSVEKGKEVKK
jgi:ribosomal protein S27AE